MEKASPEVSKAAASMSKSSVKKLASTKHKGLPMKKFSEMTHLGEEGYDRMRDRRLEQGPGDLLVATNLGLVGHNPNLCLRKRKVVKTLPLTM